VKVSFRLFFPVRNGHHHLAQVGSITQLATTQSRTHRWGWITGAATSVTAIYKVKKKQINFVCLRVMFCSFLPWYITHSKQHLGDVFFPQPPEANKRKLSDIVERTLSERVSFQGGWWWGWWCVKIFLPNHPKHMNMFSRGWDVGHQEIASFKAFW